MLTLNHWDEIQGLIQLHNRHLSSTVLAAIRCPLRPLGLCLQRGAGPVCPVISAGPMEDVLYNLKKSK